MKTDLRRRWHGNQARPQQALVARAKHSHLSNMYSAVLPRHHSLAAAAKRRAAFHGQCLRPTNTHRKGSMGLVKAEVAINSNSSIRDKRFKNGSNDLSRWGVLQ
jgi:hypothetical protein